MLMVYLYQQINKNVSAKENLSKDNKEYTGIKIFRRLIRQFFLEELDIAMHTRNKPQNITYVYYFIFISTLCRNK